MKSKPWCLHLTVWWDYVFISGWSREYGTVRRTEKKLGKETVIVKERKEEEERVGRKKVDVSSTRM